MLDVPQAGDLRHAQLGQTLISRPIKRLTKMKSIATLISEPRREQPPGPLREYLCVQDDRFVGHRLFRRGLLGGLQRIFRRQRAVLNGASKDSHRGDYAGVISAVIG